MSTPKLDITILPTFDSRLLSIADISEYPTGFSIVNPTYEITPPSFPKINKAATGSVNVIDSKSLNLSNERIPLPDGIWKIKFTINPASQYFVNKTFFRTEQIYQEFDKCFLKLDMMECDALLKREQMLKLNHIEFYIQGAIAAANNCAEKLAIDLYNEALEMIQDFSNSKCC
jgi:hypothetical protein